MVDAHPEAKTLHELALAYKRSYDTLRTSWARHPEWPDHVGKAGDGRSKTYDAAAVADFVKKHVARQAVALEPDRLYTAREIEEITGITQGTIRAEGSKGRWPASDGSSGRAKAWYGKTVTPVIKARRGYHRAPKATLEAHLDQLQDPAEEVPARGTMPAITDGKG
ncbi:hypothetical protein ABTZ78_17315 [Streptomyces bauhiniae]|uniref:hypothetical protein n=1 Tax=Streptomyces bauhiniae TaxID=2340725 RepID=UPI0033261DF2